MMSTDLQLEDVKVRLGEKNIINGVDLSVLNNSFVALLGPNGSGKTTLLKSIYRVLKPTTGNVYLGETDIYKLPNREVARKMSVVSQFQNNSFDFTVEETVSIGRTPHLKIMESERKIDKTIIKNVLKKTGLFSYKDRSVSTLSGGELQRVALARAMAQDPKIMILDEPSNHLDVRFQIEILSIIKQLGIGVLAALHDVSLAAQFCDYIYFIKEGEIHFHGTPEEVITKRIIKDIYGVDCEIFTHPLTKHICISYYNYSKL